MPLAADGSGRVDRLTEGVGFQFPDLWSKEGKLLFTDQLRPRERGLGIFEIDLETRVVRTLVNPRGGQTQPALSPDGRWLAYSSSESGPSEVYITAYPELEGRHKVSAEGGRAPVWSPDGRRLYYRDRSRMMAVAIVTGAELSVGASELLFDGPYRFWSGGSRAYDIAPDGLRFVMIEAEDRERRQFQLVLNWLDEVERLVPR